MPTNNVEGELLSHIGPGSPSGEVFRRYWVPVEISANLGGGRGPQYSGANNPLRLKILGEHLPGTYAEKVAVPAKNVLRIPTDMDFAPAASVAST